MALFFDQDWFNTRLRALGKNQMDVAAALDLTPSQVAEIWKDQRELMPQEVAELAKFFAVPAAEIADRAGVSTPLPQEAPEEGDMGAVMEKLEELGGRMTRIERAIVDLKALILDLSRKE